MDTRTLRSRLWVVVDYNEACGILAVGCESPTCWQSGRSCIMRCAFLIS
jgi:hypothetical protein